MKKEFTKKDKTISKGITRVGNRGPVFTSYCFCASCPSCNGDWGDLNTANIRETLRV